MAGAGALLLTFLAAALFYPLSRVLALGLGPGFLEALADGYFRERLLWSLLYGAESALAVLALALPTAYALRHDFPGRALWVALSGVPFVLPTIVVAAGFLALVGPRGLLGLDLSGTPWVLVWAAVFYNFGFATRILHGLLAVRGEELELAARVLGAGPARAFFRATLPALLPGLLTAAALTFLYTFASFGVPLLLGGYRYATLEVEIYRLLAYELDFERASALVVWQSAVLALLGLGYLAASRRLGGGLALSGQRPRRGRRWWLGLWLWAGLFFLLAPAPALVLASLKTPEGLGLWHYQRLFTTPGTWGVGVWEAAANTLRFSLLALGVAAPVGLLYALAAQRGGLGLELLGLFPLSVSPVSLGVGYLLAYATLGFPLFARALLPALRNIGAEVIQAAAVLGAGPLRRLLRVELPLARGGILAGSALALGSAIGEFGASLLLIRPEWTTLTLAIYERLSRPGPANYGEAMALAVVLMTLAGAIFFLFAREAELG